MDREASAVPAESIEETLARWKREEEQGRAAAAARLAEVFARVRRDFPARRHFAAGYHGCGDEGFLEYAGFLEDEERGAPADAWSPPGGLVSEFPPGVTAAEVGDLLGHFVPGGYEANEGGQGVIRVDLATGAMEIAHEWNVTAAEPDPRAYDLAGLARGPGGDPPRPEPGPCSEPGTRPRTEP